MLNAWVAGEDLLVNVFINYQVQYLPHPLPMSMINLCEYILLVYHRVVLRLKSFGHGK